MLWFLNWDVLVTEVFAQSELRNGVQFPPRGWESVPAWTMVHKEHWTHTQQCAWIMSHTGSVLSACHRETETSPTSVWGVCVSEGSRTWLIRWAQNVGASGNFDSQELCFWELTQEECGVFPLSTGQLGTNTDAT